MCQRIALIDNLDPPPGRLGNSENSEDLGMMGRGGLPPTRSPPPLLTLQELLRKHRRRADLWNTDENQDRPETSRLAVASATVPIKNSTLRHCV